MPHGDFREMARESIREFSRRTPDARCSTRCSTTSASCRATFDDPKVYDEIVKRARTSSTSDAGIDFNRVFYLSTAPSSSP